MEIVYLNKQKQIMEWLIGKERHGFYQQISEATSEGELAVVLWENSTVFV